MEKVGYIYLVTNKLNGKVYVGQTRMSIDDRMASHVNHSIQYRDGKINRAPIFHKAIAKYGWENFTVSILEECLVDNLNDRECYWIDEMSSTDRNIGYNMSPGGTKSVGHTEETKQIIAESSRGRVWITDGVYNRFCKQEEADYVVEQNPDWKFGKSMDKSFYKSSDRSDKISQSTKGLISMTDGNVMTRVRPDEIDKYMDRGFRLGTLVNGQAIYRVWITNGRTERTIQEKELESFKNKCYVEGRLSDFSTDQLQYLQNKYDSHIRQQHLNNARAAQKHNTGRERTTDERESLSIAMKEFYKTDEGKDAIKRMKSKKVGMPNKTKGIKRGASYDFLQAMKKQRGKIYVTDGVIDRLISVDELDGMLQQGYVRGRKSKKRTTQEEVING